MFDARWKLFRHVSLLICCVDLSGWFSTCPALLLRDYLFPDSAVVPSGAVWTWSEDCDCWRFKNGFLDRKKSLLADSEGLEPKHEVTGWTEETTSAFKLPFFTFVWLSAGMINKNTAAAAGLQVKISEEDKKKLTYGHKSRRMDRKTIFSWLILKYWNQNLMLLAWLLKQLHFHFTFVCWSGGMKNKNTNIARKNATSDPKEEKWTEKPDTGSGIRTFVADSVGPTLRYDHF